MKGNVSQESFSRDRNHGNLVVTHHIKKLKINMVMVNADACIAFSLSFFKCNLVIFQFPELCCLFHDRKNKPFKEQFVRTARYH